MTSRADQRVTHSLRRAAARAVLAPSIHNTQPWRFQLGPERLTMRADRGRQLQVLDPTGRQLLISCGCALLNARVSIAADGYAPAVDRLPDGPASDVFARVQLGPSGDTSRADLAELDTVVELRQTNRRRFSDDPVPSDLIELLHQAASAEEAELIDVRTEEHRAAVAELSQRADALEVANPAYRAELRAWTTVDPGRRDGVPALAVPHVDAGSGDEVPVRDFDSHGVGFLPTATRSTKDQCLLVLGTGQDEPPSWLRAGEALQRVLLEITRHGFVATPLTQAVEIPATRTALREALSLDVYPHLLLRVGRAPVTPATRRRSLTEIMVDQS